MRKKIKNSLTGFKRFRFFGIVALSAVIAVGIAAAVSAQIGTVNNETGQKEESSVVNKADKNSKSVMRQAAQTNGQTGQVRPLTAAEAQKLADGIKQLVNQSDEGLEVVVRPDGSDTVDLQGRFQNVVIAKKNSDGTVSESCIDNTQSAASFLGIDPKKFGDESKDGAAVNQSERDVKGDEIK